MIAAEQLPTIRPSDPALVVHAAEFLIRCADTMPATSDGRKQAEVALTRAVDLLAKAVRAKVIHQKSTLENKADFYLSSISDDFKSCSGKSVRRIVFTLVEPWNRFGRLSDRFKEMQRM